MNKYQVREHSEKLHAAGKSSPKYHQKETRTGKKFDRENPKGNSRKDQGSSEYALHLEKDGKTTEGFISEKHSDVFEFLRVEKDLLLKFLRDMDFSGKKLHQPSQTTARLTKCGSFPLASTSQMRNISSRSLKHKQNEIYPKGEKLFAGTQESNMSVSSYVKDTSHEKPRTLVSDLDEDSAMKPKAIISSRSSQESNHRGWNQLVLHQFKAIKQKIKHALVEFRKSSYQASAEAIHHRASSTEYSIINNDEEISQTLEDGVVHEYKRSKSSNETKASDYDSNKHDARLMRRTSSLNESLDRYTQLFEKTFSKEAKWQSSKSKSLKLAHEDRTNKSAHVPKFSRSNFSMPNLETLGFIVQEALFDTNDIGTEETHDRVQRKSVSLPLKMEKSLDNFKEAETVETDKILEKIDEVTCDQKEDMDEPAVEDGYFTQEKEEMSNMTVYLSKEVTPTLETICEDNITSHAEGTKLMLIHIRLITSLRCHDIMKLFFIQSKTKIS